jgi:ATP-dependent DNA ligase
VIGSGKFDHDWEATTAGEPYSPGNDLTQRFRLIVEAVTRLRARCCIINGETVVCGDDGITSFDRIRNRRHDASAFR